MTKQEIDDYRAGKPLRLPVMSLNEEIALARIAFILTQHLSPWTFTGTEADLPRPIARFGYARITSAAEREGREVSMWYCGRCESIREPSPQNTCARCGLELVVVTFTRPVLRDRRAIPRDGPDIGTDIPGGGAI